MIGRITPRVQRIYQVPDNGDGSMLGGLGSSSGLDEAANFFATELDAEYGVQQPKPKKQERVDDETPEEEPDALYDDGEPEDGEPEEYDDGEEDDTDEEAPEDDDDTDAGDAKPPEKVTVRVNGEDVEVSFDELKNGYSRQADYTRNMQDLAERNRKLDEQESTLGQTRQQYESNLEKLQAVIRSYEKPQAYWDNLYQQDPDRYAQELHAEQDRQRKLASIEQERSRVSDEQSQYTQQQTSRTLEQQRQQLKALVPEWLDDQVKAREIKQLAEYGGQVGFTHEELNGITDARALKVMNDAAKWQAFQAKRAGKQKDASTPRERKATKKGRTMSPGKPQNQRANGSRLKKASQSLQKTGSVNDAARYFLESGAAD